ncbi:MAG: glutathione S-transferase N-terminal domain-containing protein [Pseudomonadota bacterium]
MTIQLYTWSTPNGRKASIALEEFGLPYSVHPINITQGEQHHPDFLKISPNNKIPAILDPDGPDGRPISLFESAAILFYLAEKTGRFLPEDPEVRLEAWQWLAWQMGNFGPMLGQAHHFRRFASEPHPYAIERYSNETQRLYNVLDRRLEGRAFLAGDYSIVDMATFPWAARYEWHGTDLADFPNVKRWYDSIAARPAVQRGMAVPG